MKNYYFVLCSILFLPFASHAMEEDNDCQECDCRTPASYTYDFDYKRENNIEEERERRKMEILKNLNSIPHRPANSRMNARGENPPMYYRNNRSLNDKIIESH